MPTIILGTTIIDMWNNIGPAAENRKIKGTDPPDNRLMLGRGVITRTVFPC